MSKQPTLVDLSSIEEGYLGLIHPRPSGVIWRNQAGGTGMATPSIEGIFIPLPAVAPEWEDDPLYNRRYQEGSNDYRAVRPLVQAFLETDSFLSAWFETLEGWHQVPDAGARYIAEAWVPVRVRKSLSADDGFYFRGEYLKPIAGEIVILTYPNSD